MSVRSSLRNIWIFICIIGCLQLAVLTVHYMNYDITSNVRFVQERDTELPAIAICLNLIHAIDWKNPKMRANCNEILGTNCSKMDISQIIELGKGKGFEFENGPIVDKFLANELFNATIPLQDVIYFFMLPGRTGKKEKFSSQLHEVFDVSEFILRSSKCFLMRWKNEFVRTNVVDLKRSFISPGMIMFLNFDTNLKNRTTAYHTVYVDNSNKKIRSTLPSILSTISGLVFTSYDVYVSQLLKYPSPNDCMDYKELGFEDQSDCYDSCLEENVLQNFNKKPMNLMLKPSDFNIRIMKHAESTEHHEIISKISQDCDMVCRKQDCHQHYFTSKVVSVVDTSNSHFIEGHASFVTNSPVVMSESQQKINLTEYVTVSVSSLGFWLGFSILSTFDWTSKMLRRFKRQKKTTQKRLFRIESGRT